MDANGGLTLLSTLCHADGKETRTTCGYPLLLRDSCSGEKQEGCRNSHVETVLKGQFHSNCTDELHRRLGHSTRTFGKTQLSSLFKQVRNAYVRFAMIKKGRSIFDSLDLVILRVRSDALSLFLSLGLSLHVTLFVPRRSLFHSFSLLTELSQLTEGNNSQPESFSLPL